MKSYYAWIFSGLMVAYLVVTACGSGGDSGDGSNPGTEVRIGGGHDSIAYNGLPDDPMLRQQFGISNTQADLAWTIEVGDPSVIVAVIDTGVDYLHPDLQQAIWVNPGEDLDGDGYFTQSDLNGVDDDNNGYTDDIIGWNFLTSSHHIMDQHMHGTAIAGLIAAQPNNGIGISGAVWNCRIMPVVARRDMSYESALNEKYIEGIRYAVENGASVINLSWGGTQSDGPELRSAIEFANAQGVLVVGAAGNRSGYITPICDYDGVLCVSSVNDRDDLITSYGFGSHVDVVAPAGSPTTYLGDTYGNMGGTSSSVPHACAIGAMVFSHFPGLTGSEVARIIIDSGDDLGNGYRRINFYNAVSGNY